MSDDIRLPTLPEDLRWGYPWMPEPEHREKIEAYVRGVLGTEIASRKAALSANEALRAEVDRLTALTAADGDRFADAPRPSKREVARVGDMHPTHALRVGFDGDGDVYLSITGDVGDGVEFCTVGTGGGKSPNTHAALVALMVAIEADNTKDPNRDWWNRRMARSESGVA